MKRMFVRPALHGRGVGRALAVGLVAEARAARCRWMRLDTSIRQREALDLYRSLGFREVPAPGGLASPLRAWLVFMRLDLSAGLRPRFQPSGHAPGVPR
jgi:GNAT superfamily N-acetyltransferase